MSKKNQFEIDVKRFYAPGLEAKCPTCGKKCTHDYLSYPTANKPEKVTFYCSKCDEACRRSEFEKTVTVLVSVEIT